MRSSCSENFKKFLEIHPWWSTIFVKLLLRHLYRHRLKEGRAICITWALFTKKRLLVLNLTIILQGCTNCTNLEMEPKYLSKSDVQLKPNISRIKNDKRDCNDCNYVSCFQQISKKSLNLPLKFGSFHFSVSSSTLLTASWLTIFVSAESSWTILSIDRSEPRFESHTGGKIRITLKYNKNFNGFC